MRKRIVPRERGRPRSAIALSAILGLAASAAPGFALPAEDGVRLLASSSAGVSFEIEIGEPRLLSLEGDDGWTRLEVPGFGFGGAIGEPALPERVFWVGVPEGVEVRVRGAGRASEERDGVRLVPLVPRERVDGRRSADPAAAALPAMDPDRLRSLARSEAYREHAVEGPVAELLYVTGMRSQRVAAVRVRPASYDPLSRRLRVHRRLQIDLDFAGPPAAGVPADPEPAFEPVYESLLVNYESAKRFRRSPRSFATRRGFETAQGGGPIGFDVATSWFRVETRVPGLHRLRGSDLLSAGVPTGAIASGSYRLYTRPGPPLLEEHAYCDTCGLAEVGLRVEDGGDGRIDAGDQILFWGLGPSGWLDDFTPPGGAPAEWLDHPYEIRNVYWLTWDANRPEPPKRWGSRDVSPEQPAAWLAPHFAARVHFEENRDYQPSLFEPGVLWDQWIWELNSDRLGRKIYRGDAPGAVESEPARLHARLWGASIEAPRTPGIFHHYLIASFNGHDFPDSLKWDGTNRRDLDSTEVWVRETGNELNLTIPFLTDPLSLRNDRQAFFFWELFYRSRYHAEGSMASFASPETTGAVAYGVAPFSASVLPSLRLLDVTDPLTPLELFGWVSRDTTGGRAIYFHDVIDGPRRYRAIPSVRFLSASIEPAQIRDIRGPGLGADYLIVTADEFEPQARALAAHRNVHLGDLIGARTEVVRISDVLAWYAGGRMDPVAIRNFLFDVAVNGRWDPVPAYVLFFGDASYDFRNIFQLSPPGTSPVRVPTHVHNIDSIRRQYLSEDWLVDIDIGPSDPPAPGVGTGIDDVPDYFVGRLPAKNAAEANQLVEEKLIPYEARPVLGEWRNGVLLVADDTFQGFDGSGKPKGDPLSGIHMEQSDSLEKSTIPLEFDRPQIYLEEYPFTQGPEKPLAKADIIRKVNEGVLMWNYIGHGNPFRMSDENVFILSDVNELKNGDRLPLVIAASCDLGKFDDPFTEGLGEALLKGQGGGVIAAYSASELSFSNSNFSLSRAFFSSLFERTDAGFVNTLGQAAFIAKHRFDARDNDRKYTVQGDPGTRLAYPRHDVRLQLFDDATGASLGDSLPRGRLIRLEAEVHGTHDPNAQDLLSSFEGTAQVRITDSEPLIPFRFFGTTRFYTGNPGPIFHGPVPVVGGRAKAFFWVPLEAAIGPRAKARVYVQGSLADGVGGLRQEVTDGVPAEIDTTGPTVTLQFTRGGNTVPPDAELRIVLEDEHGINITGRSAPNRILLTLDDEQRFDLTDRFRYENGSHQRGTILFDLPGLTDGNHTIRVAASDNFAQGIAARETNRSEGTIEFTVTRAAAGPLASALNFPNPFRPERGTVIVLNGVAEAADVEVKIYTVSGSLIRTLSTAGGPGQVQVPWDGRDASGEPVSNGVYLFRAQIRPFSGGAGGFLEGRMAAVR